MKHAIATGAAGSLALCLLAIGAAGCDVQAAATIVEPGRGAMLAAGEDVTVRVESDASEVIVAGQTLTGGSPFDVTVPEVDGLGFITAEVEGEDLMDVRSWHQGVFRPAHDWNGRTIALAIGPEVLAGGAPSVATLVETLLTGEELESYVDDPIPITVVMVTVNVSVSSVTAPDVAVELTIDPEGDLLFNAMLRDVDVVYSATESVLLVDYGHDGTARYATMELDGRVELSTSGATLVDVVSTTSDPEFTASGSADAAVLTELASMFESELEPAIIDAAANAADAVLTQLVTDLRPEVYVEFAEPIEQQTELEEIAVEGQTVALGYRTTVEAATPAVASSDHGVLERSTPAGTGAEASLAAYVGSALLNQFAFAVWDAGNLDGLVFTRAELEELGLGELEFPYSNLQRVEISLLLPPLLEWDDDGPRLDLGGVEVLISVDGVADSTAWTAASVPVVLAQQGDDLRLRPDTSRQPTVRQVGFDHLSSLADQDKVMELLHTAVPGVVTTVFGEIPNIVLPTLTLDHLDGTSGPTVVPTMTGLEVLDAGFRVDLALTVE